jgi:hypothetical protein
MRWFAVFGVVLLWISDRGSHFKNEVVQRVQKELKAKHHFTTVNCPWSNGTIESACKQVIRAFRAVLSELKMYADEWPEVINMVQSVLNNSLTTRRMCGRRTSKWATTFLLRNTARAVCPSCRSNGRARAASRVESDCVFVVENLLTKEVQAAHATRLRFYKDKDLNVTAELAQAAEHNDHKVYVVSKILDAR